VLAILAVAAAVAGGNLVVTTAPEHPRVDHKVVVRATGQVGDRGRLYVYKSSRRCAQSVLGERRQGKRMASLRIDGSFDFEVFWTPRRSRTVWICSYLYAISCDAAGRDCGPATGLPPDAGFFQVRVRVRPASHSVNSAGASGRVIT
jgi:hypothetical protein